MGVFETGNGKLHSNRMAGLVFVFYAVCLALVEKDEGRLLGHQVTFVLGWWLTFCRKNPPQTWPDLKQDWFCWFGWTLGSVALIMSGWAVWAGRAH